MTLIFRKPLPNVEHPEMPADVVIVGGGLLMVPVLWTLIQKWAGVTIL